MDLPCLKNARRIFAIVSTTSIPTSASKNHGSQCGPSVPGSRLEADHPEKGVLIACRFTVWLREQSPPHDPAFRQVAGISTQPGAHSYRAFRMGTPLVEDGVPRTTGASARLLHQSNSTRRASVARLDSSLDSCRSKLVR